MTKTMMAGLAAFSFYAAQPAATALVSVDLSKEEGPVKLMNRRGTHPTERAFFRVSRELCLAAVPESGCFRAGNEKWCGKSAALGMDRDEHLFSRYGEWCCGKSAAGGFGAEIVRHV